RVVPDAHRRRPRAAAVGGARRPPRGDPRVVTQADRDAVPVAFPKAAPAALANAQLRANIRLATTTIRAKRAAVVSEVPDWEELREAGRLIKDETLAHLDEVLVELEAAVARAG